jgi:hypothetical protein
MPENKPTKSGSNLRQINAVRKYRQKADAREYYLRFPDQSIAEVAKALNISVRTVARAREGLVREGLLLPGRQATANDLAAIDVLEAAARIRVAEEIGKVIPPEPEKGEANLAATEAKRGSGGRNKLLDDDALQQMSDMLDEVASSDDVEETRKRMLRQVQRFAFDPTLHPDTRMSASQLWAKLVDMQRAKDLGPGKPLTLADAIARATDFCMAAGPNVMVPAFYAAFNLENPSVQAKDEQAAPPSGSPQTADTADNTGPSTPPEVLRPIDVGVRRDEGLEHTNPD